MNKDKTEEGKVFLRNKYYIKNVDLDIAQFTKEKIFMIPKYFNKETRINEVINTNGKYTVLCIRMSGQLFAGVDQGYDYYLIMKCTSDTSVKLSNNNTVFMYNSAWINYKFENINGEININELEDKKIDASLNMTAKGYRLYSFQNENKEVRYDSTYTVNIKGNFKASEYK